MESEPPPEGESRTWIRQQDAVAALGQQALEADDLDRLMSDAAAAVAETFDVEHCSVLELLPGGGEALLRQGVGWRDGLVGTATVPADRGSQLGDTLRSEEPVVVEDGRTEDRFSAPELFTSHDIVSWIGVVIGPVEDPWGVLGVHTTEYREFAERDAAFLRHVANILASAIERTDHERELRRYEAIVEAVNDGVYVVDESGRFTMVNDAYADMLGYEREELLGEHVSLVVDEDVVERARRAEAAMRDDPTNVPSIEATLRTRNGDRISAEATFAMLPAHDGTDHRVGVVRDISGRKQRERELEESRQRYRALVEHFPNGAVALVDGDLRYRTVGGTPLDVAGVTAAEVNGQPVREILPPMLADELVPRYEAALGGTPDSFELELDDRAYQFQVVPVRDDDGEVFAALGMSQDVTDRVEAQRNLEESEQRYRTLVENFPNGSVGLFDGELEYTAVGGRLLDTLDLEPEDRIGRSIVELYPDDLVEEVEPYFHAALDGEANSFEVEYHDRYLHAYTLPVGGVDGEVDAGMLVIQDDTERREYERALEESEARFRMLAENLEEIVWMTTPDAEEFIYLNPAFEDVWGLDRERLYDEPLSFLDAVHVADREHVRERFTALPEEDFDERFRIVRPDGIRWVHARGTRVFDGGMARIVGIGQDVTERIERERELERALGLLERTERIADVGGWEIDPRTQDVFWTDHVFDLLEVDADEEPPLEEALDMYHEEDKSIVVDAVEDALASGDPFDVEARIHTNDGGVRWLRLQGVPETVDGEVVSLRGAAQDITRRKARERALEESEAKFRMVTENLDEMVWLSDPDTREILYLNPAFEDIWGLDRAAVYDDPATFLDDVHPDDRQRVDRAYRAIPDAEFDEEYRIVRPDGEVRWLDARAGTVSNDGRERIVGIADDVTERKERERALEESERRYRTLVEDFPNGAVALFDEDLRYTAAGGRLLQAQDLEPDDRIGVSIRELYPDELLEEIEPHFRAAFEGEATVFEAEYSGKFLYTQTLPVRNADEEVYAGMLVVQDVTERREYQRMLEESNERLEQFAYAASHDLQEPLRMVSSYLQLVENRYADDLDEDGREFIEFAVDGADRMREMIEGLLQYSRVETRGDPFAPVDLDDVLADVRQDLRMKIEESDAEVTAEDLPRVYGDGSQLNQVFQNLLTNAIEYSGDDPPTVHVAARRDGDRWVVSVRDEGIGIDPEDADKVFEVFESLQGHTAGTGIGLALVERIVERHDGAIWVDSTPGEGATFSFTLPAIDGIEE